VTDDDDGSMSVDVLFDVRNGDGWRWMKRYICSVVSILDFTFWILDIFKRVNILTGNTDNAIWIYIHLLYLCYQCIWKRLSTWGWMCLMRIWSIWYDCSCNMGLWDGCI